MKRSELYFSFILVPLDFLMIVLAGVSAYYIRYADFFIALRPAIFDLKMTEYLPIVAGVALSWLAIFALSGLYAIRSGWSLAKEVYRVLLACSTGFMLIVVVIFFQRELFDSRFIILAGLVLSFLYIALARSLVRYVQRLLFKKGIGTRKVVLVGDSRTTEALIQEFNQNRYLGYEAVKRYRDFSLETAQDLAELLSLKEVDEVIQSDPNLPKAEVLRLFDFADERHLTFKYAADLLGAKVLKTEVEELAGVPVVEVKKTPLEGWGRITKRAFDLVFGVLLLLAFGPLMLAVTLAVRLDSRGPALYLDYRSGQYGKRFLFYKFRSMLAHLCDGEGPSATKEGNRMLEELAASREQNTRAADPLHKIKDDPRVTRVGRLIRRWSIDELPQLMNVIKGDISLVGPRPHMTLETAKYETHHKKVLTIKPGITGLAQISGRSDLSFEDEVKLDTYYIENWSLALDMAILLRTPLAIIRRRKVI